MPRAGITGHHSRCGHDPHPVRAACPGTAPEPRGSAVATAFLDRGIAVPSRMSAGSRPSRDPALAAIR
jgi:hypothetical protein